MSQNSPSQQGITYGLQIAAGVGLGLAVGWWIDDSNGTKPVGMIVGSMLGLASGMYLMIREALRNMKD